MPKTSADSFGDQPTLILVDELVQWVDRVLQLGELNVQGSQDDHRRHWPRPLTPVPGRFS